MQLEPAAVPEKTTDGPITVRRFNLSDIQEHGLWLFDKLQSRYPRVQQSFLTAWLRGAIETNQYHFVCTDHAVGMAMAGHRPLDPTPFVQDIFVFAKDGDKRHVLAIYNEFKRWGKSQGATELTLEFRTDVTIADIKEHIGPVFAVTFHHTRIE